MSKFIEIEFPESGITVTAKLNEAEEPEMCERFWNLLKEPLRTMNCHTLSTGCLFDARPRPPRHPVKIGFQASNLSKVKRLYSELTPGMLLYSGYEVTTCYGAHVTEPLPTSGSYIAQVIDEDLNKYYEEGKYVWDAQSYEHKPTMTIFRRKEAR